MLLGASGSPLVHVRFAKEQDHDKVSETMEKFMSAPHGEHGLQLDMEKRSGGNGQIKRLRSMLTMNARVVLVTCRSSREPEYHH